MEPNGFLLSRQMEHARRAILHILSYILAYNMCYTWAPGRGICGNKVAAPKAAVHMDEEQHENLSRSREIT